MKLRKSLFLIPASLLLASCTMPFTTPSGPGEPSGNGSNTSSESFIFNSENNYDVDPIKSIVDENSEVNTKVDVSAIESTIVEKSISEIPSEVYNGTAEIKQAGIYHLQGDYSDVMITASKNTEITIYLDGVNITSNKGIAFGSEKAIKLNLILGEGTVNTISNDYTVSESLAEANAFHVKGDVTISGKGKLNVSSTVKSAIKVSKNLVICPEVDITATSLNHAITAQSITAKQAKLNLTTTGKDGLNAECDGEISTYTTEQGFIFLEDCEIKITSKGDGIQAATFVYVSGGKLDITCSCEYIAYTSSLVSSGEYSKDDFKFQKSGSNYVRLGSDEIRSLSGMYALVNSNKGIKVAGVEYEDASGNTKEVTTGDYIITVCKLAEVTISSNDDCIHTNYGEVLIDSANLYLSSNDDGIHADYDLKVNNSSITVGSSFEGLEGSNVTIDGAATNIVTNSSDDGINAASDYGTTHNIYINDGYFRVYASGDGLDANSGLYLNGGTVIVEGPGRNNGSLDSDRVYFNGGIVFACSTNGMIETMQATQSTFVYQGTTMAAGSEISIVNSSNSALFTYTLKQSCSQIIFSSKEMTVGQTYKIIKGSSTQIASINLTSTLTKSGTSGGGGGGGGGWPYGPGGR